MIYLKKFNYKITNSTNLMAHKKIKLGVKSGIITSENQTRGKGQYGRKWISIKGNVFMSIFLNLRKKIVLDEITKLNCNLIRKSLSKFTNKKITIKKPNDLLINNKKICGILQEIVKFKNKTFIIVGIGVNVAKSPFISNYPTTCINEHTSRKLIKDDVINEIIIKFEESYSL